MRRIIFFIVFLSCAGFLIYLYHQDDLNVQQVIRAANQTITKDASGSAAQRTKISNNKKLIKKLYRAVEDNDLTTIKSILSNNYSIINYGSMYDHPAGDAGETKIYQESSPSLIANITYIHRAFSNIKITIIGVLAEGNQVFVSSKMAGNQTGQWMGYAPTGKRLILHLFAIYVIENGKIVKVTDMHNDLNVLQQLGYMPVK